MRAGKVGKPADAQDAGDWQPRQTVLTGESPDRTLLRFASRESAMNRSILVRIVLLLPLAACEAPFEPKTPYDPPGPGPYAVGTTNMQVADDFAGIGDDAMHEVLLGLPDDDGQPRYVADILAYPESAWLIDVEVPADEETYGAMAGMSLPVLAYVAYPTASFDAAGRYAFPYNNAENGAFEDMLAPGESPAVAEGRYPLVVLAHGASAHGIYDVGHAQRMASHGYIVVVPTYGDDRSNVPNTVNHQTAFLRPLITRAAIDSLVGSDEFGAHIDADNIGVSGHSFGGFTVLASAGGRYLDSPATAIDPRIKAGVLAAPWTGGRYFLEVFYPFGPKNSALGDVTVPMLCAFGTNDDVTTAKFILPAMKQLGGPTYVIELVDQPHVFEGGSWVDRDAWELLFFNAYLKGDEDALDALRVSDSMAGGNVDRQLFEYQRTGEGQ